MCLKVKDIYVNGPYKIWENYFQKQNWEQSTTISLLQSLRNDYLLLFTNKICEQNNSSSITNYCTVNNCLLVFLFMRVRRNGGLFPMHNSACTFTLIHFASGVDYTLWYIQLVWNLQSTPNFVRARWPALNIMLNVNIILFLI